MARVLLLVPARTLAAAVWCNWQLGAPVKRSLLAYDH
jgi:hypothetical protein